jgi:hypothetical protein
MYCDPAFTTKLAVSTPVLVFTEQDKLEMMSLGAELTLQLVTAGPNPVPEIDTVVPGTDPKGGEPTGLGLGLTVAGDEIATLAFTVKAAVPEASP